MSGFAAPLSRAAPDFGSLAVEQFDAFLLGSDGFWELVDQLEMQTAVPTPAAPNASAND